MAKSLKVRFQGREQEILDYTKNFGQLKAMDKEHTSYLAFRAWLKDETGNENYGLTPELGYFNIPAGKDAYVHLFEKLRDYLAEMPALLEKKDREIQVLRAQLATFTQNRQAELEPQILELLRVFNTIPETSKA